MDLACKSKGRVRLVKLLEQIILSGGGEPFRDEGRCRDLVFRALVKSKSSYGLYAHSESCLTQRTQQLAKASSLSPDGI